MSKPEDDEKAALGQAPSLADADRGSASSQSALHGHHHDELEEKPSRHWSKVTASSASSTDGTPHNSDEEKKDDVEDGEQDNALNRSVTTRSEKSPIIKVPRRERRGLLAFLTVIPEVVRPTDYPNRTKWLLTILVAIAGAAAPMGSAIVMPALLEISHDLNATPTITNLSVAIYMLAMAIFPLWWSSFSETLGRRTIYISSFVLFTLWAVMCAVSTNIAMLIVFRTLSGGAAASVQAVGAGTIADMWEPKERGRAMGIFYLGPLCGPLLSPIIGGVMTQGLGWRSTQWFLVIYGGVTLVGLMFGLPETLSKRRNLKSEAQDESTNTAASETDPISRVSTRQSVQLKTKKWLSVLRRCIVDPLSIILFLRFPAIALTVYYAAITFGSLYILNISIQYTFSLPPYSYSATIVGLLYIPPSVGYFMASIIGGRWIDYIMKREARRAGRYDSRGRLIFRPEDRMRENAYIAAILFPAALLIYGWTAPGPTSTPIYPIPLPVPMIANFFFGLGSMLIFALATTMLTEFLPRRAASGIALNNFIRGIFSCVGAVAAEPLISAVGNGWLFTVVALICVVSGLLVIWAMKRFGDGWRAKMDEALQDGGK